jgi:hypothetical protein
MQAFSYIRNPVSGSFWKLWHFPPRWELLDDSGIFKERSEGKPAEFAVMEGLCGMARFGGFPSVFGSYGTSQEDGK